MDLLTPGPSPPRCGGAAVPVLGLPASGVPDGGPAPVDPAPARANDPTILASTTHSVVECAWASRNDHGPGWEESGPLGA